MASFAHALLKYSGVTGAALRWQARRLPILMYHGLCPDEWAGEPWMPSYFTTVGRFTEQMRFLRERLFPMELVEAIRALQANRLPRHAVAVTFDDGYANNVTLAGPVLRDLGMPATVFVATGHLATGRLYNHDRLRLIRQWQRQAGEAPVALDLRASTVLVANRTLDPLWEAVGGRLTSRQTESLRPMTWAELTGAPPVLHFGGHTINHAILSRETDADAEREIAESVEELRARLRLPAAAFAYPNGQPADYTEREARVLRRLDVPCAVTTSAGRNDSDTSIFHLRRFPITLGHDRAAFESELSGVRARLARLAG